ncbi:hypothetical protein GMRT_12726 [Giardia muris]|uniref:Uncharacterized protein n=1 Tax=Giardia muris TaxID=5742 RepID=A0A4Z1SRN3_GIAMU|nr:hypothetical protein GMRT_12726 [Giardia muris]|eukprot:TNJ28562.1 hypothetical protein GMRT_12726 [Giardia muris]
MNRAIPVASQVLDRKWREIRDAQDKKRRENLKSCIDNSEPKKYPLGSRFSGHTPFRDYERARLVKQENRRLLTKLVATIEEDGEYSQSRQTLPPPMYGHSSPERISNKVRRKEQEDIEATEAWLSALHSEDPEGTARRMRLTTNPHRRVLIPNVKSQHSPKKLEEEYFRTRAPAMLMCREQPALESIKEFSDFRSQIMLDYSRSEAMMAQPGDPSPPRHVHGSPYRRINRARMMHQAPSITMTSVSDMRSVEDPFSEASHSPYGLSSPEHSMVSAPDILRPRDRGLPSSSIPKNAVSRNRSQSKKSASPGGPRSVPISHKSKQALPAISSVKRSASNSRSEKRSGSARSSISAKAPLTSSAAPPPPPAPSFAQLYMNRRTNQGLTATDGDEMQEVLHPDDSEISYAGMGDVRCD